MSIRSAAAAALVAGLPAVATAQYQVPTHGRPPAPTPVVEQVEKVEWLAPGTPRAVIAPPVIVRESTAQSHVPVAIPTPRVMPVAAQVPATPPAQVPQQLPTLAPRAAQPVVTQPAAPAPQAIAPTVPAPSHVVTAAPVVQTTTACPTCDDEACGPPGTVWGRFEWLYWAGSGQSLPPLITTALPGTARGAAGVLGQPTTLTQFGGGRANNDFRNGFRFTGGTWLNDDQTFGVEADFFFLGRSRQAAAASSNGAAIISRPFFDATAGVPAAELVSFPGVLAGSVTAEATSTAIGGGLNALHNICCDPCAGRVDLIYGFRYFHLGDAVTVQENLTSLGGAARVPAGAGFVVTDQFRTSNDFYGGVIGMAGERRLGSFFVGGRASVALGGVVQTTNIDGTTAITSGGVRTVVAGGLLAQPSNIGHYRRNSFAVMPEVGLRGGVQVTEHARVYAGYNFLYLSNVVRAGDQIDLAVNTTQIPPRGAVTGPAVPAFPDRTTDFWLQGITLGVELRY